jgi:hypothetical protein
MLKVCCPRFKLRVSSVVFLRDLLSGSADTQDEGLFLNEKEEVGKTDTVHERDLQDQADRFVSVTILRVPGLLSYLV